MKRVDDLTNKTFERWTVLGPAPTRNKIKYWRCKCKCGRIKEIRQHNLVNKVSKGCRHCNRPKKHGHAAKSRSRKSPVTAEYRAWYTLFNKQNKVTVCERWARPHGFKNFIADMGQKPKPEHLYRLARRDKTANFTPENCFWERWREEPRQYEHDGLMYSLSDLAWVHEMNAHTVRNRLNSGMTVDDAVHAPVQSRVFLTAFGETKPLKEWIKDPRCKVGEECVRRRLRSNMSHELCLITPPRKSRKNIENRALQSEPS